MKRRLSTLIAAFFALAGFIYFDFKPVAPVDVAEAAIPVASRAPSANAASSRAAQPQSPAGGGEALENIDEYQHRLKNFSFPELAKFREEVARNPHSIAPSVLATTAQLSELASAADSPAKAEAFIQFAKNCVQNHTQLAETIQAKCVRYSEKVAAKNPSLEGLHRELEALMSPRVRKMIELLPK